ncbi:MAG: hypothetical protein KAH18_08760 [Psychromonas sp.]|nr:hypothetical protein [Psychromonas sp.]
MVKRLRVLWTEYNWAKAFTVGAKLNRIDDYKGHFVFIKTNGYWPMKHMVDPAKDAFDCVACHSRHSRLNALNDFYLLGRDTNFWIELFGFISVVRGVIGHYVT